MDEIDYERGGGTLLGTGDYWTVRLTLFGMGIDARSLRMEDVENVFLDDIFNMFSLDAKRRMELYKQVLLGRIASERKEWRKQYLQALVRTLEKEQEG